MKSLSLGTPTVPGQVGQPAPLGGMAEVAVLSTLARAGRAAFSKHPREQLLTNFWKMSNFVMIL